MRTKVWRTIISAFVLILAVGWSQGFADQRIGIIGGKGFTDHRLVPSALGWGVFVEQSLGKGVCLRFTYNRLTEENRIFEARIFDGFCDPFPDTVRDLWIERGQLGGGELALLVPVIGSEPLRLRLGLGLGVVRLSGSIVGRNSGRSENDRPFNSPAASFIADFEIAPKRFQPLELDCIIRQRFATGEWFYATDDCGILNQPISPFEIMVAIAARL